MESHLRNLESRADRRERELRATVEDVKATAKLEYARLQAIHSQECREKDEELVRFQRDLELLVRSLRQWQDTAMNNNNNNNNNKVENNKFDFISSSNDNIDDNNHRNDNNNHVNDNDSHRNDNNNHVNDDYSHRNDNSNHVNDNNSHRNDNSNHRNDNKLSYNDKNKSENNNRNSNSFLGSGVDNFTEIAGGVNNKENFTKRNLHNNKNQKKFLRF